VNRSAPERRRRRRRRRKKVVGVIHEGVPVVA